jgi:hypothetical protein
MATARERISKKTQRLGGTASDQISLVRVDPSKLQPTHVKETEGVVADPKQRHKTRNENGVKFSSGDSSIPVIGRTTPGYTYVPPSALRPMDIAQLAGVPEGSVAFAPPTSIGYKIDPKALIF